MPMSQLGRYQECAKPGGTLQRYGFCTKSTRSDGLHLYLEDNCIVWLDVILSIWELVIALNVDICKSFVANASHSSSVTSFFVKFLLIFSLV